jgi:hypothetical protein
MKILNAQSECNQGVEAGAGSTGAVVGESPRQVHRTRRNIGKISGTRNSKFSLISFYPFVSKAKGHHRLYDQFSVDIGSGYGINGASQINN